MTRVGVAHLKAHLSEHLRAVRKGDEVTVMDRDTPIARVVPWGAASGALRVREPSARYGTPADVALPPPARLKADAVALLIADRARR